MITPREYASAKGREYNTVMRRLQKGQIAGAVKHPLPTGHHYWLIPSDAPFPKHQRGRPKKAAAAKAKK